MHRASLKLPVATLVACLFSGLAPAQKHDRNSYLGETPPDIVSDKEHWAGAAPPSLAQLKGKVVWLHFNF
jgi:hypothetical protein